MTEGELLGDPRYLIGKKASGYVFTFTQGNGDQKLTTQQANHIPANAGDKAGIHNSNPCLKHINPHLFRHSIARYLKNTCSGRSESKGFSAEWIQKFLGHTSPKTTMDIYGTLSIGEMQEEVGKSYWNERNKEILMEFNPTTFLAIWGAIVSSIAIGWNFYRDLSDRGRLRVQCYIGKIIGGIGDSATDYLIYSVTNTGKRPIMVINIGGRRHRRVGPYSGLIMVSRNLPKMLLPGEYVTEWTEDLSFLNKDLLSLGAEDSLGNFWKCDKKSLRNLKHRNK